MGLIPGGNRAGAKYTFLTKEPLPVDETSKTKEKDTQQVTLLHFPHRTAGAVA